MIDRAVVLLWAGLVGVLTANGCVARAGRDDSASDVQSTTDASTTQVPVDLSTSGASSSTTADTSDTAETDKPTGLVCRETEYTCDGIFCLPKDDANCGECGRGCTRHGPMGGCTEQGECRPTWSSTCAVPDGATNCMDICARQRAVAVGLDPRAPETCAAFYFLADDREPSDCLDL